MLPIALLALAVPACRNSDRTEEWLGNVTDIGNPAWRAEVEELRSRPAGQFVLRLYREERNLPASRNGSC